MLNDLRYAARVLLQARDGRGRGDLARARHQREHGDRQRSTACC